MVSKIAICLSCTFLCLLLWTGCASDEEKLQAHFERGETYLKKGEYRAAVIELKNVTQINPGHVQAYLRLGEVYLLLEEHRSAYQQYSTVVRLEPFNIPALSKLAIINFRSKRYEQSRKQVDLIRSRHPDQLDAIYLLAALHQVEKRIGEAINLYQKIIDMDPQQQQAYLGLASGFVAQGKLDQAEAVLNQAVEIKMALDTPARDVELSDGALAFKPRFVDVFNQLISTYLDQNDYDIALATCDRHLDYPGHSIAIQSSLWRAKGKIHSIQNQFESAIIAYKKAIAMDSGHLASYHALKEIYIVRNEPDKAVEMYKNALQNKPQQIELWVDLGDLYNEQSETDLAEQQYRQALAIVPDYPPAANNLAYLLANKNTNLDEALKLAKLALDKNPRNASVLHTLGWIYFRQAQYHQAIEEFQKSLSLESNHAIVHYHLGLAYEHTHQKMNAIDALEKALSLDRNFVDADQARQRLADLRKSSNP